MNTTITLEDLDAIASASTNRVAFSKPYFEADSFPRSSESNLSNKVRAAKEYRGSYSYYKMGAHALLCVTGWNTVAAATERLDEIIFPVEYSHRFQFFGGEILSSSTTAESPISRTIVKLKQLSTELHFSPSLTAGIEQLLRSLAKSDHFPTSLGKTIDASIVMEFEHSKFAATLDFYSDADVVLIVKRNLERHIYEFAGANIADILETLDHWAV